MTSLKQKCLKKGELIIMIQDNFGNVFGVFMDHALELRDSFYGKGECFLFSIKVLITRTNSSNHTRAL